MKDQVQRQYDHYIEAIQNFEQRQDEIRQQLKVNKEKNVKRIVADLKRHISAELAKVSVNHKPELEISKLDSIEILPEPRQT